MSGKSGKSGKSADTGKSGKRRATRAADDEDIDDPPNGWECEWPPTEDAPCCSRWGVAGDGDAYCKNGGMDARDTLGDTVAGWRDRRGGSKKKKSSPPPPPRELMMFKACGFTSSVLDEDLLPAYDDVEGGLPRRPGKHATP